MSTHKPTPGLKYLTGYPAETLQQVAAVTQQGRLGNLLRQKYPKIHDIRTDKQLYNYTIDFKNQYLSKAQPLNRVVYDAKIKVIQHALGQHHFITRVHGKKTKAVNEIKIASLFRTVPDEFLKMITVHELAHFREKEHNKKFYQLCRHMEPNYHQYEFDLRLYLTHLDLFGEVYGNMGIG
ncbi:M48 family metallopeptidase [Aestuariicella hydrocarbonica]|uniref:M48 family metallopeptidase n=1 Tax=Pseudomaricurvus hydrocarbonicus TaxID=1470433 RepID=A0A9E5MNR7_9GAMM|nr:YgjP-like metallopeptidase domain-containing protein [Aestuariicella hydrocarbonica]NHO67674.1 M48 family metallopeptidase [Aestuariicella hydrocarbonica]